MNGPIRSPKTLTQTDFFAGASVTSVPATYMVVGKVTVPVQEKWAPGWGMSEDQEGAPGRCVVKLATSGADVAGMVLMEGANYSELTKKSILEEHTSLIKLGDADPRIGKPFPERKLLLNENSKLILSFKTEATSGETITKANSTIRVHVTRYV